MRTLLALRTLTRLSWQIRLHKRAASYQKHPMPVRRKTLTTRSCSINRSARTSSYFIMTMEVGVPHQVHSFLYLTKSLLPWSILTTSLSQSSHLVMSKACWITLAEEAVVPSSQVLSCLTRNFHRTVASRTSPVSKNRVINRRWSFRTRTCLQHTNCGISHLRPAQLAKAPLEQTNSQRNVMETAKVGRAKKKI